VQNRKCAVYAAVTRIVYFAASAGVRPQPGSATAPPGGRVEPRSGDGAAPSGDSAGPSGGQRVQRGPQPPVVRAGAPQQRRGVPGEERGQQLAVVGVQRGRSASVTWAIGCSGSVMFHADSYMPSSRRIPHGRTSAQWNRRLSR